MELLGDPRGIFVYDDYAHHPTKVRETLKAVRQKHPKSKITAVVEPHSYSRTKALLKSYKGAFESADKIIIAPIFRARDSEKFGVNEDSIVKTSGHRNISSAGSFDEIANQIAKEGKSGDVIIVMGAGESYKLSRELVGLLKTKPSIEKDVSLAPFTTFGVGGKVSYFMTFNNESQLKNSIRDIKKYNLPVITLGGGSNLLVSDRKLNAVILRFAGKGIAKISEDKLNVVLHIEAGTLWDKLVEYAVENNFQGIECMSGIPGTVGASPVQNIGAYGQEIEDVFESLEAFDLETHEFRTFSKAQCRFGYRDSIFKKQYKNRYLITSVNLSLRKNAQPSLAYSSLSEALNKRGIKNPRLGDVRNCVLEIRKAKFGTLTGEGTAGSFFKNPVVSKTKLQQLLKDFPEISFNEVEGGYKLFAGWLIENAGWRGKDQGNVGVNKNNALVIIKLNDRAKAIEILGLSKDIQKSVKEKHGIELEREVNLLGFKNEELR
jgi:UDP-N-acetylmuramate dehydrogenase